MRLVLSTGLVLLPFLSLGLAGCGDTKIPTSLEEAKQAVSEVEVPTTVEEVKQTVTETAQETVQQVETTAARVTSTGELKIDIGQPISPAGCYARLISTTGRPAVLQLASYQEIDGETYPSVFVRAQLSADDAGTLKGKLLSAHVYVQEVKDGPVWHSDVPVEIQITETDPTTISGNFVSGTLVNTDTGARADLKGTFKGTVL